jgi:hypothetical protein
LVGIHSSGPPRLIVASVRRSRRVLRPARLAMARRRRGQASTTQAPRLRSSQGRFILSPLPAAPAFSSLARATGLGQDLAAPKRRKAAGSPASARIARTLWHLHNTCQARIDRPVDKRGASHTLSLPRLQSQGASRVRFHAGPTLPVGVQVGWRVLAGFWREKAAAGRVPSFISGCAAAKMLEGVFSRILRMA